MDTGDWPAIFDVPYCEDYGLEVTTPLCPWEGRSPRITKSVKYIHSQQLNKTYIRRTAPVPFYIRTKVPPPPGSRIKVQCVFKEDLQKKTVISRCSRHRADGQHDGIEHCAPNHPIRADTKAPDGAFAGHFTVGVSDTTDSADLHTTETFYFMCGSSCYPRKQTMQVSFTLENSAGYTLGSSLLDVHVCASPGRDKEKHEAAAHTAKKARGNSHPKRKGDAGDDDYTIQCKGQGNYELIKKIKRGLDLDECLPDHVKRFYLDHKEAGGSPMKDAATQTETQIRCILRRLVIRETMLAE